MSARFACTFADSELGALRPPDVRRSDVQAYADGLLAKMSSA